MNDTEKLKKLRAEYSALIRQIEAARQHVADLQTDLHRKREELIEIKQKLKIL